MASFVTYVSITTLSVDTTLTTTRRYRSDSGSSSTLPAGSTTMPLDVVTTLRAMTGSEPIADAGGPYSSVVGVPVVFNASNSTAEGKIDRFIWDYGDGQSAEGIVAEHVYVVPGVYRAILSIIDDVGRNDLDSRTVYVSGSSVYIDISVDPQQERYNVGEVLSNITAYVHYANGSGIAGLSLTGKLSGRVNRSLGFTGIGNGNYIARLDYPIMKGEGAFIDIYVNASFANGTVDTVKKLILVPKDSELQMIIQKPVGRSFAFGQSADFRVILAAGGTSIGAGEVVLYEEWTNNKYPFKKEGNNYVLTYDIPKEARGHIPLIIYGSAQIDNKTVSVVKTLSFDLSHDLDVRILSPKKGDDKTKTKDVRLQVTYPDGKIVSDPELNGDIQKNPLLFRKDGEDYVSVYTPRENDSKLYVWVQDALGNGGGAEVKLSSDSSNGGLLGGQLFLYATLAIGLLVCLFVVSRVYSIKDKQREEMLKEYESIQQKIKGLEEVRESLMHGYYTRKISEQDVRNEILDNEKELVFEKDRLKQIMQRLGMNPAENKEEEELLERVYQRLSSGEDPKLLKKELAGTGINPKIVDDMKKYLI